tara:strand:- start:222 stop:839 length:618 start_codon:yes stop_codon:yes gene_type:complete
MASTLSVDNIQGSASANTIDMSSVTNLHPPAGMVIQVVHGTLSGQVAVTGNNTGGADYIVDVGLNATITPRFANSRIKIDVTTYVGADHSSSSGYVQSYMIYKAGVKMTGPTGDGVGGRRPVTGYINIYATGTGNTSAQYKVGFMGGTHFDTNVGTTNATQYSIHMRSYSGGPTIYVNRSQAFQDGDLDYDPTPQSTITLTEIAV